MDAPETTRGKSGLDLLVGVEAGVLGGLVMLIWLCLTTPLLGRPWWWIPNLLASNYYTHGQLLGGAGTPTCVGAALQLAGAGTAGAVNGLITPGGRLFGLLIAGLWYLLCWFYLWKRVAPLMISQAPQPLVIAGYFLYGSILGWHPQLISRARS